MAVSLENFKLYAGWGDDSVKPTSASDKDTTPDSVIQSHISVATQIVKSMLGLTATEDMIR